MDPIEKEGQIASAYDKVGPKYNPDPGQDPEAAPYHLSWPMIWTGGPPTDDPLTTEENEAEEHPLYPYYGYLGGLPFATLDERYTGNFLGVDAEDLPYLNAYEWWPQPPANNEWCGEFEMLPDEMHQIAFVDWGNPMENILARVGQRFPVEVALFEMVAGYDAYDEEGNPTGAPFGETMTGVKTKCLEYDSSRDEIFGARGDRIDPDFPEGGPYYENCFPTVLTMDFRVTVRPPNTWDEYEIKLQPSVGPSGKMNFASAGGGWIPEVPGWHRITLYVDDPNISLDGAIVNNDEHYDLATGAMLEELSPNKLELTGIYYNTTWLDMYVLPAGGGRN